MYLVQVCSLSVADLMEELIGILDKSNFRRINCSLLQANNNSEFPLLIVLPLFLIAILLAVIVYKKRAKSDRF